MPRKINLSVAADLQDAYEEYTNLILRHDAALEELTESTIKVREAQQQLDFDIDVEQDLFDVLLKSQNNVSEILGNLETKVGELGFAPSDLFPEYQELVYALDKVDDIVNKRNNI
jgi:hypothetical protein